MSENLGAKIVIVITVLAALSLFFTFDHSGLTTMDVSMEKSNYDDDTYELTYVLMSSRTYNELDCRFVLYDANDNVITFGGTFLGLTHEGSFNINETITISHETNENITFNPKRVEIDVYDEKFDSNLRNEDGSYSQKPIYNKTHEIS